MGSRFRGGALPVFRGSGLPVFRGGRLPVFRGDGNPYLRYYMANMNGGGLPVFQGGAGLGDFFRGVLPSVLPFLAPIATRAATGFITSAARGLNTGHSLKESALGAVNPAFDGATEATLEQVGKRMRGNGRRRKGGRKGKKVYKGGKLRGKGKKSAKRRTRKTSLHFRKLPFKTNF